MAVTYCGMTVKYNGIPNKNSFSAVITNKKLPQ